MIGRRGLGIVNRLVLGKILWFLNVRRGSIMRDRLISVCFALKGV